MNAAEPWLIALLREHGPMTSRDVAEECGIPYNFARAKVAYAKRKKKIHIKEWVRSNEGCSIIRLCAVYANGPGRNASKPSRMTRAEACKRHRAKKAAMSGSVFLIAVPTDKRRVTTKKRPDVTARWAKLREAA